jgi:hypothetical protein
MSGLRKYRNNEAASHSPADTVVRRMEGAVKTEASQFAQRNREVRADGMLRSYFKGVEPAEYVGRTAASMVVDDAIPAVARGLKAVDEWTGGVLFECLKYVDPGYYNTKARRFLRDTCGLPQTFAQNVGDAVQYTGEAALLFYTFGSGNATKTAKLAGKTVPIPELATTVNRTAKIAGFELGVAEIGHSRNKVLRWRQSEIDVGRTLGNEVREQISYLYGKEVRRGMKGSVRPDFVMDGVASFEVKNYTIATNKSGLIRDVVEQAKKRAIHLPKGMRQHIEIDVRGQAVKPEILDSISQKIVQKSGGIISDSQINFIMG